MAVQREAVGNNLESGLINMSFYKHLKLDGDLRSAMTPPASPCISQRMAIPWLRSMCRIRTLPPPAPIIFTCDDRSLRSCSGRSTPECRTVRATTA